MHLTNKSTPQSPVAKVTLDKFYNHVFKPKLKYQQFKFIVHSV